MIKIKRNKVLLLILFILFILIGQVYAQPFIFPKLTFGVEQAKGPKDVALSLQLLFLITIISLAPSIIIMTTSFIRIVIVLSFLRSALATQQIPPRQVEVGLALFLTFFVMSPIINDINKNSIQPFINGKISQEEAFKTGIKPLRQFMFKQTRDKDIALLMNISQLPRPKNRDDVPTYILIPAFIMSELKTAFQMGVLLYIPFLVIDMVVASTLLSMGMIMLPPVMISLPFKILLFVMVDGWNLLIKSLVMSFY